MTDGLLKTAQEAAERMASGMPLSSAVPIAQVTRNDLTR